MLRLRDVLAALAAVALTRLAYDDPSDSLSVSVQLSYYVGREDSGSKLHRLAIAPVVLDVDGDGTVEALASVVHDQKSDTWKLEVLDLKPAASTDKTHMAPFRPKTLYQSDNLDFDSSSAEGKMMMKPSVDAPLIPVSMVTGHVPLTSKDAGKTRQQQQEAEQDPALSSTHYKDTQLNERNRHYFCGNDWHQASEECSTPCPKGTMSECPDGQQCFADTPCDISDFLEDENGNDSSKKKKKDEKPLPSFSVNDLLVTPAGGLPSIFSLWSNGALIMHSLTGDFPSGSSVPQRRDKIKELLGVRQMWQASIVQGKFDDPESVVPYEWTNVAVNYVDSTDTGEGGGMVVVQAHLSYHDKKGEEDDGSEEQFMMAFDAETGRKLWDVSLDSDDQERTKNNKNPLPLPLVNPSQSKARRRSLKPHVHKKKSEGLVSNCLHAYRRSLLTSGILPYQYFGDADANNYALHFEQQQHNQHAMLSKQQGGGGGGANKKTAAHASSEQQQQAKSSWKNALSPFSRKRHHHHHHKKNNKNNQPKRGKPNVIVSKSDRGLQVRSLKNGRSVCHLSLWYDTLYTDLNHDGVLDSLFVVTGDHLVQGSGDDDDDKKQQRHQQQENEDTKWITGLATRLKESRALLSDNNRGNGKNNGNENGDGADEPLADSMQTLCHLMALSGIPTKEELFAVNLCGSSTLKDHQTDYLDPGPLLAVETLYGKGGSDVIVALNDQSVMRIRGISGRRMWTLNGKHYDDFPMWQDGYYTLLERLDAPNVLDVARPIVLAGDTSLAILSPGHGSVLATAAFPQPSIRRPILVDFNGDGTTDIVVVTQEAVWGYRVMIRAGTSIFFRIVVGLLVVGMMLALLQNRFGPHPGKRSTDA